MERCTFRPTAGRTLKPASLRSTGPSWNVHSFACYLHDSPTGVHRSLQLQASTQLREVQALTRSALCDQHTGSHLGPVYVCCFLKPDHSLPPSIRLSSRSNSSTAFPVKLSMMSSTGGWGHYPSLAAPQIRTFSIASSHLIFAFNVLSSVE